ncbi:redoxin family protein [Caulobacter segnis]|uniref:redoxin family protein n=1 Tax=Caulobacter segnis TaxID=88688 RepID=UPI001CBD5460|nr:redoxin family protein [Caulobacter segnis]UAL09621.1 redoxin family protein [Caulobacter segnis]
MTTPSNPTRRDWLKAAAGGVIPLALGGALALPPARQALARAFQPSPILDALRLSPTWLNSPPLDAAALRGRTVVVCFWTYSCINSLRILPYLRGWKARYGDRGLTVIGVHTPEFAFEAEASNVHQALGDLGVDFPVVLDSDRRIWSAFGNNAWPAFYIMDGEGRVRGRVAGEGQYESTERLIQRLLSVSGDARPPAGVGPELAADWDDLGSGETYVGYAQASGFASPGGQARDVARTYESPRALPLNRWSLTGAWTVGDEFATGAAGGGIAHHFRARDLHMVLAPSAGPVRYRVRLDSAAPGSDHGVDVGADGQGVVDRPRMYQLVRQAGPVADRIFEVAFLDPGVRAYVFTFG